VQNTATENIQFAGSKYLFENRYYIHNLMYHSQNIILYICKQYIKIRKPHVAYSENAYCSARHLKSTSTACTANHLSITVSVLPSIASLSLALFLYRYYLHVHLYDKLELLWIGRYEMWRFYPSVNALQPI